jgi:sigma-E factor negative regulatory protein RseC
MEETGTVEKILPNGEVLIAVARSSACGSCSMSGFCFSDDSKTLKFQAKADFPVIEGQSVKLSIDEGSFLKYSIITYLMPVVLLILGAIIGTMINSKQEADNPVFAIIGGIFGLLIGLFLVRNFSRRLENKNKTIIKILDDRK